MSPAIAADAIVVGEDGPSMMSAAYLSSLRAQATPQPAIVVSFATARTKVSVEPTADDQAIAEG
jgi:transketolase